jgi:hypothetical protein
MDEQLAIKVHSKEYKKMKAKHDVVPVVRFYWRGLVVCMYNSGQPNPTQGFIQTRY